MSDAIKKLHDYLAKSPSVIYPEDVLAYLPAIEAENAKLRELVVSYDSALRRMCDQMQRYVDCHNCILGKDYGDDSCAIDELREAACVTGVELE